MIVEASITINASKAAVWTATTDIANFAQLLSGVEKIEVVEKPANGLVGLKWKETRILFGKEATVEKWITEAKENEFYRTRAEQDGFVFITTNRVSGSDGAVTLTGVHETQPQGFASKLKALPMVFFKGVIKKAILQDLEDIKAAVEAVYAHTTSPSTVELLVMKGKPKITVVLTRDSVAAGDDSDAPHEKTVTVHSFMDPVLLARTLSTGYLPSVAGVGHTWTCVVNDVSVAEITTSEIRALVQQSPFAERNRAHFVYHSARY